ncbi:MAG: CPXCG motif-containing cysteine-rich protein [Gammaproteobacteria bacterium]|nr:CPXCG motif-containing cysteine-rich protein [Gammaproteobacteria bacterium]MDH5777187.1 CPXCG motif-containing cysteine-rich protein [Gammaproteobacteria bacterium]
MLTETSVHCPYCGESFVTLVDTSAGNQQYIEDCQVCCSPILFDIDLSADGELQTVNTKQDNE